MVNFDDEDSELVSDIFNLFARHQRRKIKKAMRRGREEAFRQGKWPGQPLFGYQLKTFPFTASGLPSIARWLLM
ncbi:hypothetical protein [Moorella sp. E308F]|uniref:hypothetical protein n=1 Tax=Moorella sp. E308F TaxID=2572682 RepID=UPI0035A61ABF